MSRLVLHTGRFRDMGYETGFSGSAPTPTERAQAERLLAGLRRGTPEGGVGILRTATSAGRGVEEILALMLPGPLLPESEARVKAELEALYREALPALLAAAARAPSVTEARESLRRGLDSWADRLTPLLAFAPAPAPDPARAAEAAVGTRRGWMLAAGAALAVVAIAVTVSVVHLSGSGPVDLTPQASGPDACRPNGAADDVEIERLLRAQEASTGYAYEPGDPFSLLDPADRERLGNLLPETLGAADVCHRRRTLGDVHRDLENIRAALEPEQLQEARATLERAMVVDTRFVDALERLAALDLPAYDDLCADEELPCVHAFTGADLRVLAALREAYGAVSLAAGAGSAVWSNPFGDPEALEEELRASAFRTREIQLRGEMHKDRRGGDASALLDPLSALLDCPRLGECTAYAARRIAGAP